MDTSKDNLDQLEQIWSAMMIKTFDEFIIYHIGFTESKPVCFGTGDSHSYCATCPWQISC